MKCWEPAIELSKKAIHHQTAEADAEAVRVSSLHRHELFDDKFQQELEGMYRDTGVETTGTTRAVLHGAAAPRLPPHLRRGGGGADGLMDLRWQMVPGCLARTNRHSRKVRCRHFASV